MSWNLDWVTVELAIGGSFRCELAAELSRDLGVRAVIDVRSERCDDEQILRTHGITLLHLPTGDLTAISGEMIETGVAFACERLGGGDKVFIHCEHGIGRSALLTWCVLVARGDEPVEALLRLKNARERVSPSPPQIEAFVHWAEAFQRRTHATWEVPSFDPLARIAYRNLSRATG